MYNNIRSYDFKKGIEDNISVAQANEVFYKKGGNRFVEIADLVCWGDLYNNPVIKCTLIIVKVFWRTSYLSPSPG